MADLKVTIGADASEYNKTIGGLGATAKKGTDKAVDAIDNAESEISGSTGKMAKNVERDTGSAGGSFTKLGKLIAGAFVLDKVVETIVDVGKQMLDITAKFETYNAVLTNTLGSQQAAAASMKMLQDFASATPFSVDELTASYVKLANQGFLPTTKQLTLLGDLASSTGKSFDQLTEAILDAQTGEYERLKEFGIRAQDNGDKVTFTFKGVQTQVEKTSSAIRDYITSLGGAEGVTGSMEAISKTLTGQLSNLGDSWDAVLVSFGNRTSGVFKTAITQLNAFLQRIADVNRNLQAADKLGEGKSFFQEWSDRIKSLVTGRVASSDVIGEEVASQSKYLIGVANKAMDGAKTPEDFNKALKTLADAYGAEAKRLSGSASLMRALNMAYEEAKSVVVAQQTATGRQGNANFGKAGGNAKPKVGFDINEQAIKQTDQAIETALRSGNTGLAARLQERARVLENSLARLKEKYDDLAQISGRSPLVQATPLSISGESGKGYGIGNVFQQPLNTQPDGIIAQMQATVALNKAKIDANSVNKDYTAGVKEEAEQTKYLTSVIGEGLTGAFNDALSGTKSFLSSFGSFLQQLIVKIAAAAAAALALSAVLAFVTGGTSLLGGAGASTGFKALFSTFSGLPKFAEGGIVSKPTVGLFGEKGTEVIMPINKLQNFVNTNGNGGNFRPVAQVIKGDLLVTWIKEASKSYNGRS